MKIYQLALENNPPSWFKRKSAEIWENYRRLPPGQKAATTVLAAAAAVPVAIATAPEGFALAAGAATGGGVVFVKSAVDYLIGSGVVCEQIRTTDELSRFTEYFGAPWCTTGTFYLEHPKRPGVLLRAAAFHRAIADEQIADLKSFIRAQFPVRSLRIVISNHDLGFATGGFSTGMNGQINTDEAAKDDVVKEPKASRGNPFSAKAHIQHAQLAFLYETYSPAEKVPLAENLLWMDDFKSIHKAAQRTSGGTASYKVAHSLAFGLKAEMVEAFGIEAGWCSNFTLTIDVLFGDVAHPEQIE